MSKMKAIAEFLEEIKENSREVVYEVPVAEIELGPRGGIKCENGSWMVLNSEYTDESMIEVSETWIPVPFAHIHSLVFENYESYLPFIEGGVK